MLNGIFGQAQQARYVTITGGFTITAYSALDIFNVYSDIEKYRSDIEDAFAKAGFALINLDLYQNAETAGFTAKFAVWTQYTAEQQRQNVINVLKSISHGLAGQKSFSGVYAQIMQDGSKTYAKTTTKDYVSTSNTSTTQVIKNAVAKTADDVANKGVVGVTTGGLDSFLFGGEPIDILGAKIPKLFVYGGIAIGIYSFINRR